MSVSESQKRATRIYNDKNYERIALSVKKGEKDKIRTRAMETGRSINSYIIDTLQMEMKNRMLEKDE